MKGREGEPLLKEDVLMTAKGLGMADGDEKDGYSETHLMNGEEWSYEELSPESCIRCYGGIRMASLGRA